MKILLMLLAISAQAEELKPVFDEDCLADKIKACGEGKIPAKGNLTPEQQKLLLCRLDAIISCRTGSEEVNP